MPRTETLGIPPRFSLRVANPLVTDEEDAYYHSTSSLVYIFEVICPFSNSLDYLVSYRLLQCHRYHWPTGCYILSLYLGDHYEPSNQLRSEIGVVLLLFISFLWSFFIAHRLSVPCYKGWMLRNTYCRVSIAIVVKHCNSKALPSKERLRNIHLIFGQN